MANIPGSQPWKYHGRVNNIILDGALYERVLYFTRNGWKLYGVKSPYYLVKNKEKLTDAQFWKPDLFTSVAP